MTKSELSQLQEVKCWKTGRGSYFVESRSRSRKRHFVDLEGHEWEWTDKETGQKRHHEEPTICTCEAFRYHGHRPCFHIIRAMMEVVNETMRELSKLEMLQVLDEMQETNDPESTLRLAAWIITKPHRKPPTPHDPNLSNQVPKNQPRTRGKLPRSLPSEPARNQARRGPGSVRDRGQ